MKIKKIWAASFSPTGGTERIVSLLAEELGERLRIPVEKIAYTLPAEREKIYSFAGDDLLILGAPVYAGRIPNKILPDVDRSFEGKRTPAVAVSVFGNRNYDDALMELSLLLEKHGFHVAAAAAAVSRHAFSDKVGTGRPDAEDMQEFRAFAEKVAEKIRTLSTVDALQDDAGDSAPDEGERKQNVSPERSPAACGVPALQITGHNPVGPYYTPLRADGQPAKFLKARPLTDKERCIGCGVCAQVCPMGSISPEDTSVVSGVCIKCQACIRACPVQAKYFTDEDFLSHVKMLEENYTRRAENAFFLSVLSGV